jgi:hypothetical protein
MQRDIDVVVMRDEVAFAHEAEQRAIGQPGFGARLAQCGERQQQRLPRPFARRAQPRLLRAGQLNRHRDRIGREEQPHGSGHAGAAEALPDIV